MNQINPPSGQLTVDPGSDPESCQEILNASPQLKRDFEAALRRAGRNKNNNGDHQADASVFGALASMPLGTTASQVTSSNSALSGGGVMTVVPNTCGTLPDSAPMTAGTTSAIATEQQWRLNIPGNDPSSSAMAVRLVNSGAGQWQVRVATDSSTRQQLTPGLGQLREKLRQDSGNRIDDLGFDDDIGSESSADTQT